ncbi:hypothetical protein [Halocatena salina]|uniref:DUF8113 domain-containing protein n=1 Tax=Halocatena salina TaxID=2934340 RepID=A0A8U0A352_9EURY|nr:hypothetical protein [Halocatena salina]UPM42858.1 hypothetical protein MW046_00025 [Halocatena salina]
MSHEYERAKQRAIEILENGDHDSLFVCTSSQDGKNRDVEVVTGVDSDRITTSTGYVRLEQICMHLAYLSNESNVDPSVIPSKIVTIMRNREIGVEVLEE